jgi:hypothetical protein
VPAAPVAPRRSAGDAVLQQPFSASLRGTIRQGVSRGGMAVVDLRLRLSGGASGVLRIRIGGQSVSGGGVLMRRSAVTLGPRSAPGELAGRVDALQGTSLEALVGGPAGPAVRLRAQLNLGSNQVSGTVSGSPVVRNG